MAVLNGLLQPARRALALLLAIACALALTACSAQEKAGAPIRRTATVTEVSPPAEIQRLGRFLDRYQPQVQILQPAADAVLTTDAVTVQLTIADLPIFRHPEFELGPHIDVVLDEREHRDVFDVSQPLVFADLTPGTHTLRAFASRPWHESFKNREAYAQVTFHVYEKTAEHAPVAEAPLLAYNMPAGNYGGEPILLDFYLRNLPLSLSPLTEEPPTWRVRVTVDGESFVLDRWQSTYLKGWQPGRHVVKLELLDENDRLWAGPFNSTARLVNYTPNGTDALSRLLRGEIIPGIEAIVDPNYAPTVAPAVAPTVDPPVPVPAAEAVPGSVPSEITPVDTNPVETTSGKTAGETVAPPVKKKRERKKTAKKPSQPPAATEPVPTPEALPEAPPATTGVSPEPEVAPEPAPSVVPTAVPTALEGRPEPVTSSSEAAPDKAEAKVRKLHELLQQRLQEQG
ncbi:MAG: hypothetical protein HC918_03275 [Oscillatoriales cyanobacterium SM2_1_8]|nr:hypothetical protein [Oscillatoriales cyanobacterium SM2_1_8]